MKLPGVLAQIANVAGEEAALAIAEARGGTRVYIPPKPDADHWMSRLVGHEAALAIGEELTGGFAGLPVDMPLGPAGLAAAARARIDAMIAEGKSESYIARATGYTTRAVRRRRAALGKVRDSRQLTLF